MDLLDPELRAVLRANADAARNANANANATRGHDPAPVVKYFSPVGAATWLATELDADGDTLFGLADLGFGCPELGYFSLSEIEALRLPFGLTVERDLFFASPHPLSVWADAARSAGTILWAERLLGSGDAQHRGNVAEGERLLRHGDPQTCDPAVNGGTPPAPHKSSDPDPLPPPAVGDGCRCGRSPQPNPVPPIRKDRTGPAPTQGADS